MRGKRLVTYHIHPLGHLFFNPYSQTIDIWSTYPQTKCEMVVRFVHLDFREQISRGSKHPTHPRRIRRAKIDGVCYALETLTGSVMKMAYVMKKNHNVCCKNRLENN